MFEREIKFIYDFNLNKVNKLGPYFTFDQLAQTDIHPAILQYISAEIDYIIFEDRQKLLKNSVFDYSGDRINYLFNQIGEEVKSTKRFSHEYVAKLILHATSFTVNYLVQPRWTLVRFVFDESNHKTTGEIKQIFKYVYYYPYSINILNQYINTKKILSMNTEELESLLAKSDQLGIENYLQSILSTALKSMAEFFNIGEVQKNKIMLGPIMGFLEEKEMNRHIRKLKNVFGEDLNAKFKTVDIHRILNSVLYEKNEEIETQQELIFEDGLAETGNLFESNIVLEEPADEEISNNIETGEEPEHELSTFSLADALSIPLDEEKTEESAAIDKNDEPEETENIITNFENYSAKDFTAEEDSDVQSGQVSENDELIPDSIQERFNELHDISALDDTVEFTDENMDEPDDQILNDEKPESDEDQKFEADNLLRNFGFEFTDEKEDKSEKNNIEVEDFTGGEEKDSIDILEKFESMINLESIETDEKEKRIIEDDIPVFEEEEILSYSEIQKREEQKLDLNEDTDLNISDDFESTDDDDTTVKNQDDFVNIEANPVSAAESYNETHKKVDMNELLEHKDMTKVIQVIFDYDIEEFATTLDEISLCKNLEDVIEVVNQSVERRGISRNSKEAQTFRSIISKFFE